MERFGSQIERSDDGGKTWLPRGNLPVASTPHPLREFAVAQGVFYFALASGLLRSVDEGFSWSSTGVPDQRVTSFAVSPLDSDQLLISLASPPSSSWTADGGTTLEPIAGLGPTFEGVWIDPLDSSHLFAGALESFDGGEVFAQHPDLPLLDTGAVLVGAPAESQQLVAWRRGRPTFQRSFDSGRSFEKRALPDGGCDDLVFDAAPAPSLLCLSAEGQVLESRQGTLDWVRLADLPAGQLDPFAHRTLIAHPQVAQLLFAISPRIDSFFLEVYEVAVSRDGGRNWQPLAERRFVTLRFDPITGGGWAVSPLGQLWRTTDLGHNWEQIDGLPGTGEIVSVHALAGVVYLQRSRLFRSFDGGHTWQPIADGLGSAAKVFQVTGVPGGGVLYAATGAGLFRSRVSLETACPQSLEVACLDGGRFAVTASWSTPEGQAGSGFAEELTADTATFWFFGPDNVELVIKVLDGCHLNEHLWVFVAGLTNVAVELSVFDLIAQRLWSSATAAGQAFQPIQDIAALPCGPS